MLFMMLLLIGIILVATGSAAKPRPTTVVLCQSLDCNWNKLCRCTRDRVGIADAMVKGLCAHHTQHMRDRIIEPLPTKKVVIEHGKVNYKMLDKICAGQDEDILKDDAVFDDWMKRHMKPRKER